MVTWESSGARILWVGESDMQSYSTPRPVGRQEANVRVRIPQSPVYSYLARSASSGRQCHQMEVPQETVTPNHRRDKLFAVHLYQRDPNHSCDDYLGVMLDNHTTHTLRCSVGPSRPLMVLKARARTVLHMQNDASHVVSSYSVDAACMGSQRVHDGKCNYRS